MIIVLLLPDKNRNAIRWTAAVATGIQVLLAGIIFALFDRTKLGVNDAESFQFVEKIQLDYR
jgi:NADH-quinone oxidoreductase subunit M